MPTADTLEPDFIEINGIEIVKPDARFPIGQYIKLGPNVGIMFPSLPFGPRGAQMTKAFDRMLSARELLMNAQTEIEAANVSQAEEVEKNVFATVMSQLAEPMFEFYKAGLLINYTENVANWIVEKIPIDMASVAKLIPAVQGEVVDEEFFRSKP